MVLSKAKEFGDVIINTEDGIKKIDLVYTEKTEKLLFLLKLKVSLQVFTEWEQQQILDDDFDFFEMDDNDDYVSDENDLDDYDDFDD
jgi:hypothetical protein